MTEFAILFDKSLCSKCKCLLLLLLLFNNLLPAKLIHTTLTETKCGHEKYILTLMLTN